MQRLKGSMLNAKGIFNIMALKHKNTVHTPAATVQNIYVPKDNFLKNKSPDLSVKI